MNGKPRLLSMGCDKAMLETRNAVLRAAGFEVYSCLGADHYLDRIAAAPFDVVVVGDCVAPARREQIAQSIRGLVPSMRIVMMYRCGDGGEISRLADACIGSLDSPHSLIHAIWACLRRAQAAPAGQ